MKSSKDLAAELGVSMSTVARIAKKAGIAKRWANSFVFDAQEEQEIRSRCHGRVGNPNFTEGNYFGQPKPAKKKRKAKKS